MGNKKQPLPKKGKNRGVERLSEWRVLKEFVIVEGKKEN